MAANPVARIKSDITLKHRANLGEEQSDVAFKAGDEVQVLRQWSDRVLFKDAAGRLFTLALDLIAIDAGGDPQETR